jgi:cytochrome c oxidase assembly protein subunit 11
MIDAAKRRRMQMTAMGGVAIVAVMTGLAFSAPPLYDLFCRVTGFGGTTQVAQAAPSQVLERTIEVRFDANVAPGLPLEFRPKDISSRLRLGETGLAFYEVRNTSDRPVTVVATYNVTPHKTGIYFQKLECFCFQERVIPAGEAMELPVVYYVAPELATNRDTEEVQSVTLSYTFFAASDGRWKTAAANEVLTP